MVQFENKRLPPELDISAPVGSDVWVLFALTGRGIAHLELALGKTSKTVFHKTVERRRNRKGAGLSDGR